MNKRIIATIVILVIILLCILILVGCIGQEQEPEEPEIKQASYIYFIGSNCVLSSNYSYIDHVYNCTYIINGDMIEIYATYYRQPVTYKTKLDNVIIIEATNTNPAQQRRGSFFIVLSLILIQIQPKFDILQKL